MEYRLVGNIIKGRGYYTVEPQTDDVFYGKYGDVPAN